MEHPTSPETGLGDGESLTLGAQETVCLDADIVVVDEGVHAFVF